jgi:hypothetical protein
LMFLDTVQNRKIPAIFMWFHSFFH